VDTVENGGTVKNAGLQIGTYGGGSAQTMTVTRAATADGTEPDDATTGVLNGDTLKINGIAIGAAISTDDTASIETTASSRAASAIAIAAAINKETARTGVTATANANTLRGTGFTAVTAGSATIYLNGESIAVSTQRVEDVINGINEYSGKTGVVATKYGDGMQLTAADGRNILIGATTGSAANFGLTGVTLGSGTSAGVASAFYSTVTLTSELAFSVQSGSEGDTNFELLGFRNGTYGGAKGDKIAEVNISTQQGASDALRAIDAAIEQVSAAQANSGALNNRLDVIVNNLGEGLQNMSASRSRILDTDYATETTDLAKQQIIQQAATAMLAQANQQAQGVLALLK